MLPNVDRSTGTLSVISMLTLNVNSNIDIPWNEVDASILLHQHQINIELILVGKCCINIDGTTTIKWDKKAKCEGLMFESRLKQ